MSSTALCRAIGEDSPAVFTDALTPCALGSRWLGVRPKALAAAMVLAIGALASTAGAGVWSVTNHNPAGSTESGAIGVSGGQQVGYAFVGGHYRASLWNGSAASWVDLDPAGSTESVAGDVSGGQQVGYARMSGQSGERASLWSGTAASWVDLNPVGSSASDAWGVGDGRQVGFASIGGHYHASLWSGTAASWMDLNPAGATSSDAKGVSGGQQVGYANVGGQGRASLWSGSAASWVDLNPAGSTYSEAQGVDGGGQVGLVVVGGQVRASLWSGNAGSWEDLSAFLPSEFSAADSYASSIWSDTNFTYVTGYGYNTVAGRYEALLWTQAVPEPGTLALLGVGILCAVTRRRCIR
jgi:hypothetical protein